jgi:hypothetical protein
MATLLVGLTPSPAEAHILYVRHKVLPDNQVQIQAYFQKGAPAVDGIVRVYRSDGTMLVRPGVLDEHGVFTFFYSRVENLKVNVTCDGHSRDEDISATELTNPAQNTSSGTDQPEPSRLAEILAGISMILALAAFYLSVRTAARLRRLPSPPHAVVTPQAADRPPPAELPTVPVQD